MAAALEAVVVNQSLNVSAREVYEFAHQEENLPKWASGLAEGVHQRDGKWFAKSPMGEVQLTMSQKNAFGVMDHDVKLPNGQSVHNALRVTPAGEGSLLSFIVLRTPGTEQKAFDADVAHVRKDLQALKQLLEKQAT